MVLRDIAQILLTTRTCVFLEVIKNNNKIYHVYHGESTVQNTP